MTPEFQLHIFHKVRLGNRQLEGTARLQYNFHQAAQEVSRVYLLNFEHVREVIWKRRVGILVVYSFHQKS